MDFRVLGPVLVRDLVLGAGKHRAVLAVLLLEANRAVRIERLVDLLWADQPPERARNLVSGYVSKVRKALDGRTDVRVETWRGGYRLVVPPDSVDLYRFRRLVQEARGGTGDHAVVDVLSEALALWTGPALVDVDLPGLAPSVTEALEQERVAAFEELVDARLRIGADTDLLRRLGEAVDAHPFRERLVGQHMTALAQCGRPAEALAAYRRCADALRDELGVAPGAALRELERAVRADAFTPPAPRLRPAQLPADLADFTGRTEELAALTPGEGPLVITGMPGTGKTALAVHWAHRMRERFPDGQLHVDLRGEVTPRQALLRLLDGLGVRPEQGDERALSALFRSTVDGKKLLLLLDGATSTAQVRPLLPGSPSCQVIITSSRRLDGLALRCGVRSLRLGGFRSADSVALLQSLLGERALRDPVSVRRLATLCCGLPVAVRTAAVRLAAHPTWPVAHLVEHMADEERWATSLTLPEDDGSFLASAFQELPDGARSLLGYFGLLPREELGASALTTLTNRPQRWVEDGLAALHDAHLLLETVPGVYRLPTVVRLSVKPFLPAREVAAEALERWRYPGVVRLFAVDSA
ncbi:winged helix-turn-helix domain-containing protein [Allokutzneria sp. A3M-2-11 16]|uniref:AfsR/SARP family transcriptional regulator n=1 Tax=Allokutzneria sp. A3M-2-11 16 TaxID=2962043 RepID=UPI0020B85C67|nr:BTAD domain-containing putative transcriptional regulator [Allokutzneria sp. A3M-2-11 16]MCP3804787.1 winged helix-turn-helix domain-containing protein [Allokutzneria sp. A3M-2-11 16]